MTATPYAYARVCRLLRHALYLEMYLKQNKWIPPDRRERALRRLVGAYGMMRASAAR